MNAFGVIAEYNPFHNGHLNHLREAKRLAGDDAVIVVMSGNFVQRGEPAILNKWDRTELALKNGADLVIEIPTLFCLGNAKQYANASVKLLESIGCVDRFVFGSESGNIEAITSIANCLKEKKSSIDNLIKDFTKEGFSYPRARALAFEKVFPDNQYTDILNNSNDALAIEYLLVNSSMKAIAIPRIDNISASKVRESYFSNIDFSNLVPETTKIKLEECITTNTNEWFKTLQYAVMNTSNEEIEDCPSGGEGLGNRIKSLINDSNSWDEFVQLVKSKRYTYTRISRLCMQIVLGISRKKYPIDEPKFLHILGANTKGREVLSQLEKEELNKLPLISNISKQKEQLDDDGLKLLELDVHASDIYNLVTGRDVSKMSDYRIPPIIIE